MALRVLDTLNTLLGDIGAIHRVLGVAGKAQAGLMQVMLTLPEFDDVEALQDALSRAAERGHIEAIKVLLADPRVDPSARTCAALQLAASAGQTEAVALLLSDVRVDPSVLKSYALRIAACNGHVETMRVLMAHPRVYPAARLNHAVRIAAKQGHANALKLLLEDSRVDPTACGNNALKSAVCRGHSEVVRILLKDDRVNASYGWSYELSVAFQFGHKECVRILLSQPGGAISPAIQEKLVGADKELLEILVKSTNELPAVCNMDPVLALRIQGVQEKIMRGRTDLCLTLSRLPLPDGIIARIAFMAVGQTGELIAANTTQAQFLFRVERLFSSLHASRYSVWTNHQH